MADLSSPIASMKPAYTVVVVGSGYGGGISASRLARAGQSVCVLERGREVRPGSYPNTLPEALEEIQTNGALGRVGSATALFDFHVNEQMSALVGCGLGGTSLINANVAFEPTPAVFADARWPADLRVPGALDEGYRRASEMLSPTPFPDRLPAPPKLLALKEAAGAIPGARFSKTNLYITFDDPPGGVNRFGVPQAACTSCGNCVSGCNFSAKNTVLMNYLPDAKNHGAEIFTQVSVTSVGRGKDGWVVSYTVGADPTEHTVTGSVVILAAGTLGSTELLLRSQARGLALSPMVGQRLSSNGDLVGFSYNTAAVVNGIGAQPVKSPPVGPCITGVLDARSPDAVSGFIVEDASVPGALAFGFPEEIAAGAALVGVNTAPEQKLAQDAREADSVVQGAYHGATQHTQTLLSMGYDDGDGVMFLEKDRLRIAWNNVGTEPTFTQENDALLAATRPLAGIYVRDPLWTKLLGNALLTVHPLGGCVMADSAELGVVDAKGRVYSGREGTEVYDGLYVTDGSVVPMPLAVNPSFTISAISERCCALIAADRGWTIDYGDAPVTA